MNEIISSQSDSFVDASEWELEKPDLESYRARARNRAARRKQRRNYKPFTHKAGRKYIPYISVEALRYAERQISAAGYRITNTRRRNLIEFLGKLLNPGFKGAAIGNHDLSNHNIASDLKKVMLGAELMACKNPKSYMNEQKQEFLPSPELVEADMAGVAFKASWRGYRRAGRSTRSKPKAIVQLNEQSAGIIARNVVEALEKGTGLYLNTEGVVRELGYHYTNIKEKEDWRAYCRILGSLKHGSGEIVPRIWKQDKTGMLFAYEPRIQDLPMDIAERGLESVEGKPVWRIECRAYYPVLGLGSKVLRDIDLNRDYYGYLGSKIIERGEEWSDLKSDEVKDAVINMLHGQAPFPALLNHEMNSEEQGARAVLQIEIDQVLDELYPDEWRALREKLMEDYQYLNRLGARVFYSCCSAGLEESGMKQLGIPTHDGLIFSADQKEYESFLRGFINKAETETGYGLSIEAGKL